MADTHDNAPFPAGSVAVIFTAMRSGNDEPGYQAAAAKMAELASRQPGYLGLESARGADGLGVTVSYWASDDAARQWRDHAEHAAIRERGRAIWYDSYRLHVARIERGYSWP